MHPLTRGSSVAPHLRRLARRPAGAHRRRPSAPAPATTAAATGRASAEPAGVHRRPGHHRRRWTRRPTRVAGLNDVLVLAVELRHRAGRRLGPDLDRGRRRLRGQGPLRRGDRRHQLRRDRPRAAGRRRPRRHRRSVYPTDSEGTLDEDVAAVRLRVDRAAGAGRRDRADHRHRLGRLGRRRHRADRGAGRGPGRRPRRRAGHRRARGLRGGVGRAHRGRGRRA